MVVRCDYCDSGGSPMSLNDSSIDDGLLLKRRAPIDPVHDDFCESRDEAPRYPIRFCPELWEPLWEPRDSRFVVPKLAVLSRTTYGVECVHEVSSMLNYALHGSSELGAALLDMSASAGEWGCCVIVVDHFGSISEVFDRLHSFRMRCPHVPVVLASTQFSRDDLSCERLPLCDVSVKLPCSLRSLLGAIVAAEANNLSWQTRVDDVYSSLRRRP